MRSELRWSCALGALIWLAGCAGQTPAPRRRATAGQPGAGAETGAGEETGGGRKARARPGPAPARRTARRPPSTGAHSRQSTRTRTRTRPGPRPGPRPRRVVGGVKMVAWTTNASSHRGKNGTRVALGCPAGGTAATVWGTGMYTDDSSVCTAAAHAGLITLARGGVLTVEIAAGQAAYTGSTQHGVTSASWGTWSGSFFFVGSARPLPARLVPKPGGRRTIAWNMTARHLRSQVGKRITYVCSARGQAHTVWGSGIYTDDSSICTAAVHAGFVTFTAGGRVTLEIQSGQAAYQGSRSHGVTTASWRNWTGSFIFVVPMTAPAPAPTP